MLADTSKITECKYNLYALDDDAYAIILHNSKCKLCSVLCKLWKSLSQVSLNPSLVNVHIQHPPEAEVQVHQVARVQPGQRSVTTEGAHSVQQRSQPGNGHEHTTEHNGRVTHNGHWNGHSTTSYQNGHVGRCFQETVDGQVLCYAFEKQCLKCFDLLVTLLLPRTEDEVVFFSQSSHKKIYLLS